MLRIVRWLIANVHSSTEPKEIGAGLPEVIQENNNQIEVIFPYCNR